MSEKPEEKPKLEYLGLEKLPIVPNQIKVATSSQGILVSFFFIPPEDLSKSYAISRVVLNMKSAEELANGLKKIIEEKKKKEEPQGGQSQIIPQTK